jgi:hypothetical protein
MDEGLVRRSRLSTRAKRLIRSYGVVILIAIGFLLLALFVHEAPKTVPAQGLRIPSVEVAGLAREV